MGLWNANYNNIIKLFNHTLIIAPKFGVVYRKRFRLSDILMKLQNGAFRIITRESYEIYLTIFWNTQEFLTYKPEENMPNTLFRKVCNFDYRASFS